MGRLIEDISLREKIHVFEDRTEAGKRLSEMLSDYKSKDVIVLAIPAGGVPVGYEIAKTLCVSLDLIIVRKIQFPDNPEAGFGAVGPDEEVIFNELLLSRSGLAEYEIDKQVEKTKRVVKARNQIFREGRPFPELKSKDVIIVDDGLASGYTMYEAVRFIKRRDASKVIIAVPTAPQRTVNMLLPEVDELYCLNIRISSFFAVADAYRNWYDVSDDEVISILKKQIKEDNHQTLQHS
jgi:predicted phosphoribosyltransferase